MVKAYVGAITCVLNACVFFFGLLYSSDQIIWSFLKPMMICHGMFGFAIGIVLFRSSNHD